MDTNAFNYKQLFSAKVIIWGLIALGFIIPYELFSDEIPIKLTDKIGAYFLISWIVGIICPNAVIRFGLPSNRALASQIYTTILAFVLGLSSLQEQTRIIKDGNTLENFIINFLYTLLIFIVIYPKGTILYTILRISVWFQDFPEDKSEKKDPEQKESEEKWCIKIFMGIILRLILGLIVLGIINGLEQYFN